VPEGERIDDRPEADQELYDRLTRLVELIDMFEHVTEALLPLVKKENEPLLRRLVRLAESLAEAKSGESDTDSAHS
jgi:hypothetical protein